MSFLSPLFLLALPLIAVPVAIHLIRGRQRDTIDWGAMDFLLQAVAEGRRLQRLEEWLLLALRTLAVLAIVLALARPLVSSRLLGGGGALREVVLVLDDSLSMGAQASDGAQTPFATMKELAAEQIGELSSSDRVQLLLASNGGRWLTPQAIAADSAGRTRLGAFVEQIQPTHGAADLSAAIGQAIARQAEEDVTARAVVVMTDSARTSWRPDAKQSWKGVDELVADAALPTQVALVDCADHAAKLGNLAVTQVAVERPLVRRGEKLKVIATVHNFSDDPTDEIVVRWEANGEPAGEAVVAPLAAGATGESTVSLTLDDPGVALIEATVDGDDALADDDHNAVAVDVADRVPVLVVHEPSADPDAVDAADLFHAALGYFDDEPQPWHSSFQPVTVAEEDFEAATLGDYRAVVFTDLPRLADESIDRLEDYVRAGGGVWVALGERIDRSEFNARWYDDGAGMSPLALDDLATAADRGDESILLHPPEPTHPATRQLADTARLDIEQLRIGQLWQYEDPPSESPPSVLLETDDGRPFVVEKYLGEGRVLLQAAPMGVQWTNLPLLKSYVVLVQDWLDYLTAPAVNRFNLQPGDRLVAAAPADFLGNDAVMIEPSGTEVTLPVLGTGDVRRATHARLRDPGVYEVRFAGADDAETLRFVVARSPEESDLSPLTAEHRAAFSENAVLAVSSELPTLQVATTNTAQQTPSWPLLLTAAALLLAVELFAAHRAAQQRFGTAELAA